MDGLVDSCPETALDRKRVLIVEDEPDVAASMYESLADGAMRVEVANNGVEALAKARALQPHAIVLDVRLPGLDGFEVFRVLRREPALADTRVIIVTAHAESGALAMAKDLGAYDCVKKPYIPDRLRAKVMTAVGLEPTPLGPAPPPAAPPGTPALARFAARLPPRIGIPRPAFPPAPLPPSAAPPRPAAARPPPMPPLPPPPRSIPAAPRPPVGQAPSMLLEPIRDGPGWGSGVRPFNVAVIDADGTVAEVLRAALRVVLRAPFTLSVHPSGYYAIQSIEAWPPDLVFLDRDLPDLDAIDVLKTIRLSSRLARIPIIVTSSRAPSETDGRLLALGASNLLFKPFESCVLNGMLRKAYARFAPTGQGPR